MESKSKKPLRLFVNPFAIWTDLAFKTGEAILASAHAAAVHANAPKVAVIPTSDAPSPKAPPTAEPPSKPKAAARPAADTPHKRQRKASARRSTKSARSGMPRTKARKKAGTSKRRAKR